MFDVSKTIYAFFHPVFREALSDSLRRADETINRAEITLHRHRELMKIIDDDLSNEKLMNEVFRQNKEEFDYAGDMKICQNA